MIKRITEWMEDRFGIGPVRRNVMERRVVTTPWYYGDGATLTLLLGVLVLTGVAMTLTYNPSPEHAYESVVEITERQRLGWFVRSLHYWSAGIMVVVLFAHMCRQILLGGYKSPREATWLIGVGLFFAVLAMSFTGYILRWDTRALYALKVSLHMFQNVPLIGDHLVIFAQGGTEIGARTLSRLYALHAIILPVAIAGLVGWHLYLVMLHGVTAPAEARQSVRTAEEQRALYDEQKKSEEYGETFHPNTTMRSGAMAVCVFFIVALIALLAGPAPLHEPATLTERAFPVEEWWFWWYSALIALLPAWLAPSFVVLFPIVLLLVLAALPFVDRGPRRGIRKRPVAVVVVIAMVLGLLYLSDLRRRSPWTGWPSAELPPVPEGVVLADEAQLGRVLYLEFGCNTCHAVAGVGRQIGPDFVQLAPPRTREEMREFILRPPPDVVMPPYDGRIGKEALEAILDFVHAAQMFPKE